MWTEGTRGDQEVTGQNQPRQIQVLIIVACNGNGCLATVFIRTGLTLSRVDREKKQKPTNK